MRSKDTKKLVDYYRKQKVTGTYDAQREATLYRRNKRGKELGLFLKFLGKKPSDKVLELGCSSGFLTKHLGKVTAIDTSEKMLEIAGKKNPKAKCVPADMFKLPFKDKVFDKVVTMRVWNHLDREDLNLAIRESRRVLKKGGILLFDAEEKNFLRRITHFFYKRIFRTTGYKIYQYSLRELKRILAVNRFEILKLGELKHKVGRQIVIKARKI